MAAERTSSLVSRINVNGKYMFSCMYAMFLLVMPNQGQPEVGLRGRVKRNRCRSFFSRPSVKRKKAVWAARLVSEENLSARPMCPGGHIFLGNFVLPDRIYCPF